MSLNLTVKPLLKLSWLCLDSFSWNLENCEVSTEKTKSSISIKNRYFYCLNHSLFYGPLELDKSCFQKIDLSKLLKTVLCIVLNSMYTLLCTNCCTIWNLGESQLLLTKIILYWIFYYYMYFVVLCRAWWSIRYSFQ